MEHEVLRRASVAAEIRAELARRQLNVAQLSRGAGIKIDTLRGRLAGKRPFTLDELDSISAFFGFPIETLILRARVDQ